MSIVNDSFSIGTKDQNLVFETAGHIYIKVKDKYYELDFRNNKTKIEIINNQISQKDEKKEPEKDNNEYVTLDSLKDILIPFVTRREWQDVKETQKMLENAQLEGFTESINPITINTMQVIVGSDQLQFEFIKSFIDDTIVSHLYKIDDAGDLVCPSGIIKHFTLDGPDAVSPSHDISQYCRWKIKGTEEDESTKFVLENDDSSYYLYIKVPCLKKDIAWTDASLAEPDNEEEKKGKYAKTGEGVFIISESSIKIDSEDGYYYLLYATIGSADEYGNRSISTMNGFTEILPGQITAWIFKSVNGESYLDLKNNILKLGDKLSYNLDGRGNLFISGAIVQDGGGNTGSIDLYRGIFNSDTVYYSGNLVTWTDENGLTSTYRYKNSTPAKAGETTYLNPSNTEYWDCIVKGSAGGSSFKSTVFRRTNKELTDDDRPKGGDYLHPYPDDTSLWTDGIPSGEEILWASTRIFSSNGEAPEQPRWETPRKMTDTANFDVEFSNLENPDPPSGHPNGNKEWSDKSDKNTIWMATSVKKNGEWSPWQVSKIKGESGQDGTSINIKGTLDSVSDLPNTGSLGDSYIINGDLYVWTGEWINAGPFRGEKGDQGDSGNQVKSAYAVSHNYNDKPNLNRTEKIYPPTNWFKFPPEPDPSYEETYIWQTIATCNGDNIPIEDWSKPFIISGKNGKKGEDGTSIEFIYKRSVDGSCNPPTDNKDEDDYVPAGWTDNPTGVKVDAQYEFICSRKKKKGIWGEWSTPAVWSKWGEKGEDGDGIEYIFYIGTELPEIKEEHRLDKAWLISDEGGWHEDPQNVSEANPNEYVSIRRKVNNEWQGFSDPILWTKYAKDGLNRNSFFKSLVFRRTNKTLTEWSREEMPTGGSWTSPVPTNKVDGIPLWSDGIPGGEEMLWCSTRIFSSDSKPPEQEEWTLPQPMTETADLQLRYIVSPDGWPDPPPDDETGIGEGWDDNNSAKNITHVAFRRKSNGVWGKWQVIETKGEKGDAGMPLKIRNVVYSPDEWEAEKNNADRLKEEGYAWLYDGEDTESLIKGHVYIWYSDELIINCRFTGDDSHIHIKFCNKKPKDGQDPIIISEDPDKYIGIYADNNKDDSANWHDYKWEKWSGEDGLGYEYIYLRTNKNEAPICPKTGGHNDSWPYVEYDKESDAFQKDDFVPECKSDPQWTDRASGVNSEYRYEWVCCRKKVDGVWNDFIGRLSDGKASLYSSMPQSAFTSIVFRRFTPENNDPETLQGYTPEGGDYSHPIPTTTEWSDGIPKMDADSNPLYMSKRIFTIDGEPPQGNWSTPILAADSPDFDVCYHEGDAMPSAPTEHGKQDNSNGWYDVPSSDKNWVWMATSNKKEGQWSDWVISKIKGEKGDKGDDGKSSFLHLKYATDTDIRDWTEKDCATYTKTHWSKSNGEEVARYRGICVDNNSSDPYVAEKDPKFREIFTSYKWEDTKGETGEVGASPRVRQWKPNTVYCNGKLKESDVYKSLDKDGGDDIYYLDFVYYDGDRKYYECVRDHESNNSITPTNNSNKNDEDKYYWKIINNLDPIATNVLLIGENGEGWVMNGDTIKHVKRDKNDNIVSDVELDSSGNAWFGEKRDNKIYVWKYYWDNNSNNITNSGIINRAGDNCLTKYIEDRINGYITDFSGNANSNLYVKGENLYENIKNSASDEIDININNTYIYFDMDNIWNIFSYSNSEINRLTYNDYVSVIGEVGTEDKPEKFYTKRYANEYVKITSVKIIKSSSYQENGGYGVTEHAGTIPFFLKVSLGTDSIKDLSRYFYYYDETASRKLNYKTSIDSDGNIRSISGSISSVEINEYSGLKAIGNDSSIEYLNNANSNSVKAVLGQKLPASLGASFGATGVFKNNRNFFRDTTINSNSEKSERIFVKTIDNISDFTVSENTAIIVGANNSLKNCAIDITGGYVSGLALKPQIIGSGSKKITINNNYVYTVDKRASTIIVLDPTYPILLPEMDICDDGHIIFIKNVCGGTGDKKVKIISNSFDTIEDITTKNWIDETDTRPNYGGYKIARKNENYSFNNIFFYSDKSKNITDYYKGSITKPFTLNDYLNSCLLIWYRELFFPEISDTKGYWVEYRIPREW